MTVQLVIFQITIITMAVIKIKQTALIIVITEQVFKAITTAIVTQVEEVVASIAVEVLQVAHVLQEYHKLIAGTSIFL
jgi:hypothetical protein